MAEANVGPPESAPDESGSGEEQKEEKQDEEGEGDRAFEVEMSSHATNHWVSSHDMNILFFTGACSFLPSSSSFNQYAPAKSVSFLVFEYDKQFSINDL